MMKSNTLGLYLHIPFCIRKCNYCDFLSGPCSEKQMDAYCHALCREIALWGKDVKVKNILDACKEAGNDNRAYYFFSTSKITFPGAGVSIIASSDDNIAEIKKVMTAQTIGYDKINQLRHVQFFKNADGIRKHMQILADCLKPKFETVLNTLEKELEGSGLITWENPKGGYFVSVDVLPGCAKRVVELAKEAGVALTGAGATYPYKNDPKDSNLRIAPSYPTVEELQQAMDLFCVCVKKAGIEKLLEQA